MMRHADSMKPFDQMSRNLDRMADDFQSMAKNLTQMMNSANHDMKK